MLSTILLTLVVGFIVPLLLFILYIRYQLKSPYWKSRGIPVVTPYPSVPVKQSIKAPFHDLDLRVYAAMKKEGLNFSGRSEFGTQLLFITDPELIKSILIKDFDHFVNRRSLSVAKSDPYFHKLLFNMENQEWKEMRVTMTPTFTSSKIKRMFSIFDTSAKNMVQYLETLLGNEQVENEEKVKINLQDPHGKFTLSVIAASAFGFDSQSFSNTDSEFNKMSKRLTDALIATNPLMIFKIMLILLFPKIYSMLKLEFFDKKSVSFFASVTQSAIKERESEGLTNRRDDFLQLMIEAKHGQLKNEKEDETLIGSQGMKLTDELILAQAILFFNAGFDTVQALLDFCIYELAINPEVQENLFEEVNEAFNMNENFTHEIISSLPYLDMVVSETLRKYPPAFRLERKCNSNYRASENLLIEKGTVVVIPVLAMQMDPDIYPNPDKFIPERFSAEARAERHPSHYLPFGIGQRSCIAQRFALVEGKVAIAHLIRFFKFEPCSRTTIPMKFLRSISGLKPSEGIWLNVTKRAE